MTDPTDPQATAPVATPDAAPQTASAAREPAPRRRAGLGRGLSALLGDSARGSGAGAASPGNAPGAAASTDHPARSDTHRIIPIADITPLPGQPRRRFDADAMEELTASVRARGVLQPILVRPSPGGRGYQLIAGERRWRASQAAGVPDIPAIVRSLGDAETYEIALIENIQRADLSVMEEARGYARLMADHGHQQEALARLVGKSRSHVANLLRLLTLPEPVQSLVDAGQLQMGHARALIGHADAETLARRVVAEGLSVRRVEVLAKGLAGDRAAPRPGARSADPRVVADAGAGDSEGQGARDPDVIAVETHLSDMLGLSVVIQPDGDGSGRMSLSYATLDELDMLCQRLSGEGI